MIVETEAAILTKLVFEQNNEMRARMSAAQGNEKDLVALVMPLFREMLSQLAAVRQAYETFPSAIPVRALA
jgi:hypothetical protein